MAKEGAEKEAAEEVVGSPRAQFCCRDRLPSTGQPWVKTLRKEAGCGALDPIVGGQVVPFIRGEITCSEGIRPLRLPQLFFPEFLLSHFPTLLLITSKLDQIFFLHSLVTVGGNLLK